MVTEVTSTTADGTYNTGDQIDIIVTFDENVYVAGGTPTLTLETGLGTKDGRNYVGDAVVNYANGTGTTDLTFTYTVETGHYRPDLEYASRTALIRGGTIKNLYGDDATGNVTTITLPALAVAIRIFVLLLEKKELM